MPELPEVESLRRDLSATLVGRTIVEVEARLPRLFLAPTDLALSDLAGKRVLALRRRAKFLLVDLSDETALVIHLRLAGQLVHRAADGTTLARGGHPVPAFDAPLPHKSTHFTFLLDDGSVLYLTDIRQFGRVWFLPNMEVEGLLAQSKLGPEPLDPSFTLDVLRERLAKRGRAQLKALLLDQQFIGGVGNIYADEITFESGLTPATRADEIAGEHLERLYAAIRSVLSFAVREGVAEILNGKASPDRDFPKVHGRAGAPCPRCGTTIQKIRFVGRGTYTCPSCQPMSVGTAGRSPSRSRARARTSESEALSPRS
ncbi:MAG: bifunctional DNA-formamidopyrimidine glycosylase/DNA-(apurinic or apyrimidinic site) lyase [Chloroflexota bacterium]|nr:bifunctional DNA-formamidopyrimidine glycosylase/DNA-(apurinic or apyrimidinic site) lyase [Chloroflexota bacterium]